MKTITLLLALFLSAISVAQIGIIEDFNTDGIPSTWTSQGFNDLDIAAVNCDGVTAFDNLSNASSGFLITPSQTSNGTDLSINFDYKVSVFSPSTGESPAPADWGSIVLEYSLDAGTTWVNVDTINDANDHGTFTCETQSYTIPAAELPSGSSFIFRYTTNTNGNGTFIFFLDNVAITQVITGPPSCNALLTIPENGAVDVPVETDLVWSSADGLPTGYKLTVGTSSGNNDVVDNETITGATTYSFSSDLEFSTTYYVTIRPFNDFGDATEMCTEYIFTTRNAPLNGASCDDPIVIDTTTLDYSTTGNTELYEDDYSSSPCSGQFLIGGNEIVYTLSPATEISVDIELTNIAGNRTAMHLMNDCPDVATTCFGFGDSSNDFNDIVFNDVVLAAGETYYLIIASTSTSSHATFDLDIKENSCVIPTVTYTATEDCSNDQYFVAIDFISIGSATSITIDDDQASTTPTTITETGVTTVGPYPSGTEVAFTLTNNQDSSCVLSDTFLYTCPPANDECSGAVSLPVNGDDSCTLFTAGSTVAATESTTDTTTCNGTNDDDVWFSFIATNASHIVQLQNLVAVEGNSTSMGMEVSEGTCDGGLTNLGCFSGTFGFLNDLTLGNEYKVRVWSTSSTSRQTFDICIKTPPAAPANNLCTNAIEITTSTDDTCDNSVSGTTLSATNTEDNACSDFRIDVWYTFTPSESRYYDIVLTAPGTVTFAVFSGTCGALTQVSASCSVSDNALIPLNEDETYYVLVQSPNTSEGVPFEMCIYAAPIAAPNNDCSDAEVIIESEDATGNNSISGSLDNAYYSPEGCAGTNNESVWYSITPEYTGDYFFEFTRTGGIPFYTVYDSDDCTTIDANYVPGFSSCFNSGAKTGTLEAGNTYLIMVHGASPGSFELFAYPDPAIVVPSLENDFCEDAIALTLSTDEQCTAAISGTTINATTSGATSCTTNQNDVWYSFAPATAGYYTFNLATTSATELNFSLYSGACGTLTAENDCLNGTEFTAFLNASETYYILVMSAASEAGADFELCVYEVTDVASNNACIDAEVLPESDDENGNNTISGSLENAFFSPEACGTEEFASIWYTFTPAGTGTYLIDFTATSGNASFAMYDTDDCTNTGTNFVSGITDCENTGNVAVTLLENNTYLISVQASEAATFDLFAYAEATMGVEEQNFIGFTMYPNPVENSLNLRAAFEMSNIALYNVSGQLLISETPKAQNTVMDMSTLATGVYFVQITIEGTQKTFKIVKQ